MTANGSLKLKLIRRPDFSISRSSLLGGVGENIDDVLMLKPFHPGVKGNQFE